MANFYILYLILLYLPKSLGEYCDNYNVSDCDELSERNYFDSMCFSPNSTHIYGDLGCNAGGKPCCRFCEFGNYINVSCIASPSVPPFPPLSPPLPPFPPLLPPPPSPPAPPLSPRPCAHIVHNLCDGLVEPHLFDTNCYAHNDVYGNLGCNAGGIQCCRFCGFGNYENISCIQSPSMPPLPPRNPLIMPIVDVYIPPEKAKIEFNIRIGSSIEEFDENKFKKKIRNVFRNRILTKDIKYRIRPGSLIIDVLLITNNSMTEEAFEILDTMTPSTLGVVLNESVIELSEAIVETHRPVEVFIEKEDITYPLFMLSIIIVSCSGVCFYCCYKKLKRVIRDTDIFMKETSSNKNVELDGLKYIDDIFIKTQEV